VCCLGISAGHIQSQSLGLFGVELEVEC